MMRWVGLMLAVGCCFAAERTAIVVRHAERAGGMGNDVPLSKAGECRAGVLASMLADAGVREIFTSDVLRTKQTAAPLAEKTGVKAVAMDAKDVKGLVARLRAGTGTAVVVGHSNTVPEIVKTLSGENVPAIADTDFDNLYVVTGKQVLRLHYRGCEQ